MKQSLLLLPLCLLGCVGSPIHETTHYNGVQSTVRRNNAGILALTAGMDKPAVEKQLRKPERSEGYPWGSVWLYRTAMTSGTYGTADEDFTPLVFNTAGQLEGWGRNYYIIRASRYGGNVDLMKPQSANPP